jgi:ATP-dependent helicase/nuclease subunit A
VWEKLQQRLRWTYPFLAATRRPAKTSVTALRRTAGESDEDAASRFETSSPGFGPHELPARARRLAAPRQPRDADLRVAGRGATAEQVGNAHHAFLQFVPLERTGSLADLREAAQRLREQGILTPEDEDLLDFTVLDAFWRSDLGGKIRAQAPFVHRELAFTARFSPREIAAITGQPSEAIPDDEFIVVQGVADMAVMMPTDIWLVDFKTDAVGPDTLADRIALYAPQVKLYTRALSQIYGRPVSGAWLYFLAARTAAPVEWQG